MRHVTQAQCDHIANDLNRRSRKRFDFVTHPRAAISSTPIVVGERLFVLCEPDELVCLDKTSGKKLWSRFVNFYAALTPAEHRANPA